MDNSNAEKTIPSTEDLELAANAVFSNPDTDAIGLPPDGYRGLATVSVQRVQDSITGSDFAEPVDVWYVQWPFEPVGTGGQNVATWMFGFGQAPSFVQNQLQPVSEIAGYSAGGYAGTLEVGGLCCYVMKRGESPFPGPYGPHDPLQVKRLVFGDDVLHDSARAIGGFYEVIDTTNALNQQGTSYHASIENPTNEKVQVFGVVNPTKVEGVDSTWSWATCDQELMPIGDPAEMSKVMNSLTLAAKEGVFAPARINLEDNSPTQGLGYNAVFVGGDQYGSNKLNTSQRFVLYYGNNVFFTQKNPVPPSTAYQCNASFPFGPSGKVYKTNLSMQVSLFTGLSTSFSHTFFRRLATHCLCTTASKYYTFAKYGSVPPDPQAMAALQSAIDNTPDFFPSASNANGKAWKMLSGKFKKALKAVKNNPLTSGVTQMAKQVAMDTAMNALSAAPGGAAAVQMAKRLKKLRKKPKSSKIGQTLALASSSSKQKK